MHHKILENLDRLSVKYDCRILFAAESGSRAWGFASPDSDYDVRVIYIKPLEWYLQVSDNSKDTFEEMLPDDLDFAAWDLRKALMLFAKSNFPLMEWLQSPCIYYADADFHRKMIDFMPAYFNPLKSIFHYLSMYRKAIGNLDDYQMISIKKLFYAIRGMLAAEWSLFYKTMPPTEFEKLLVADLLPPDLYEIVLDLQMKKEQAKENEKVVLPASLHKHFLARESELNNKAKSLANQAPLLEPLDMFFRKLLMPVAR